VNEVTVSEVTATEVIHTEMTGTVTEEAIAIAVVIRIRATVTREAGQHRRHCSSSLSRHHPCVAETTGTEIVVGMLGPGMRSLPALRHRPPTMTEVEADTGTAGAVIEKGNAFTRCDHSTK